MHTAGVALRAVALTFAIIAVFRLRGKLIVAATEW